MGATRRRPRRSPWPVVAAVVTVLVLVITAISRASDGPDPVVAYLDDVRPVVERSNQVGQELEALRSQPTAVDRTTLRRKVARLIRESRAALSAAQGVDPPDRMSVAHGLLLACLAVRARAVTALEPALEKAIAADPAAPPATALVAVGQDLAIGDRSYTLFVEEVPKDRRDHTARSAWVPRPEAWQAGELTTLVAALRSAASLRPVHDVSLVTVSTNPPAAAKDGDADVLPAVKAVVLTVVVANVGSETERRVAVEARLSSAAGEVDVAREFVTLSSGQRMAVRLRGLNPLPRGRSSIAVRVGPVPDEVAQTDNQWTRAIVVR